MIDYAQSLGAEADLKVFTCHHRDCGVRSPRCFFYGWDKAPDDGVNRKS